MFRTRTTLARLTLVVCVAAALCATTAGSALAGWFIEGSELTGTAALATTASVDENILLKAAGVTVTCTDNDLEGVSPQIEAGSTASASSLIFKECSANANCTVTKTLSTVPVMASVVEGANPAVRAVFSPKTKTIFATIKYNGAECALLGTQPITGKAATSLPTGQEENPTQEDVANVSEASGELKVGSSPAELKGATLLKLATENQFMWCLFCIVPNNYKFAKINTPKKFTIINNTAVNILIESGKIPAGFEVINNTSVCYENSTITAGTGCVVEIQALEAGKAGIFTIKPKGVTPIGARLKS